MSHGSLSREALDAWVGIDLTPVHGPGAALALKLKGFRPLVGTWDNKDVVHCFAALNLVIDKAPWHRGALIRETLSAYPHLRLDPLPSYSPHLNVIERLWRVLRRRVTHNRLFASPAELRAALRASLCYYQTLKHKVLSLIQWPRKVAKSAALWRSEREHDHLSMYQRHQRREELTA